MSSMIPVSRKCPECETAPIYLLVDLEAELEVTGDRTRVILNEIFLLSCLGPCGKTWEAQQENGRKIYFDLEPGDDGSKWERTKPIPKRLGKGNH